MERPFHENHALIKPGGLWGHGFGIIGSIMMIVMHTYSIRKRVKFFQKWGSLKKWLHFHIFLGVVGPLLVMVHTTGKVNGLVSLSFWSMVLVFLSGFVGRFFYGAVPRRATGLEYSLEEAIEISEELRETLKKKLAHIGKAAEELDALESRKNVNQFLKKYIAPFETMEKLRVFNETALRNFRPLWGFSYQMIRDMVEYKDNNPAWKFFLKSQNQAIKKRKHYLARMVKSIKKTASLKRKVKRWKAIQARLYYWHVFHKPLSVLMYIVLVVHVYIAAKFGFVWIF